MKSGLSIATAMLLSAALLSVVLGGTFVQPAAAADLQLRPHHHHRHHARAYGYPDRFVISYNHNYGPVEFVTDGVLAVPDRIIRPIGAQPYAYYDVNRGYCEQSSASYRGQDGRRHPCN
jgi:hypothetical protein